MPQFLAVACLSLLFLLLAAPFAQAEEDTPKESARELMAPPPVAGRPAKVWEASLATLWMPSSDISDAGGRVGIFESKAKLGRSYRINPRLSLTPDLSYSLMQIDASAEARLPDALHTVSPTLRTDYSVDSRYSVSLLLAPQLAGDFTRIRGNDLRVRYGLTGRYNSSQRLTLLAGFIYQQGYHSTKFFPIIGGVYRPDDRWTINIAAPRPGVSYAVGRHLRLNVGAEFSGGEYQLHEERAGAKVIRYRDFRILGGVDFAVARRFKAELAAGYALDRKFQFYELFDPNRPDVKVADGPFLRAGLKAEW